MRTSEAREVILAAVERARAGGWVIAGGVWATENQASGKKCCCPLAALCNPERVALAGSPGEYMLARAARLLDVSSKSVDRFILGFDCGECPRIMETDEWVLLGQALRAELLP